MSVSVTIPSFNLSVAQSPRSFEQAVPIGPTEVNINLDWTSFTQATRSLTIELDISYDNGANWSELEHATYQGGPLIGDGGAVLSTLHIQTTFHQPDNPNRRMRASLTAIGGTFSTPGGTLTATP